MTYCGITNKIFKKFLEEKKPYNWIAKKWKESYPNSNEYKHILQFLRNKKLKRII